MAGDVTWHGASWLADFRRQLFDRLDRAGAAVAARVRENIDETGPHSGAGEFPHKYSGRLQASVDHRVVMAEDSVVVTADASYAGDVEERRPFLSRTLAEMVESGELQKAFDGE